MQREKTGVSSHIVRPTKKQQKDRKQRSDNQKEKYSHTVGALLGQFICRCSNCKNRVRMQEDIGDRKILCTKCNAGVFKPAKK